MKQIPASELKAGMVITDSQGNRRFVTRDPVASSSPGSVVFRWDLTRRPTRQEMMTITRATKLYTVTGAA